MESKDLSIVIVTFKSEDIIFKCLKSIPNDIKVIIVENSKNEKFKKNLENKYKNIECILTGDNRGYAAANNIGLNLVKTKYALVLNPDCILGHEAISNFFITANNAQDFHLIGPAQDQMNNIDFKNTNFIEVENIKGFAIPDENQYWFYRANNGTGTSAMGLEKSIVYGFDDAYKSLAVANGEVGKEGYTLVLGASKSSRAYIYFLAFSGRESIFLVPLVGVFQPGKVL